MPVDYYYVYILESSEHERAYYVGLTQDLKKRLAKHNHGEVPHSSKYRPWRIKNAISFVAKDKAVAFERYLKSHSGRAFAKKRF